MIGDDKVRDQKILRRESDGTLVTHADVSAYVEGHLNDMVVDAHGRAYAGCFGFDLMGGAPITTAPLVKIDPDGSVSVQATDIWFPNGCVVTADGKTLLVCESFGNRISAFDISQADGSLSGGRVWASFGDLPSDREPAQAFGKLTVVPDGCSLDADGALWAADGLNGRVIRVKEGGEIVDEIVTGTGCFSCALGGEDGKTLFVCLAPDFHEEARKNARDASIAAVKVDVSHAGWP